VADLVDREVRVDDAVGELQDLELVDVELAALRRSALELADQLERKPSNADGTNSGDLDRPRLRWGHCK
jgi:hypothetical protein